LSVLLAAGCSTAPSEEPFVDREPELTLPPVGPFLDGVFPPRAPNDPEGPDWTIVPAFPNLELTDTLAIASTPTDDRIYVGSRNGLVVSFDNQPEVAAAETFLDLRDRVAVVWDGGFLGLVFHPEFGDPVSPFRDIFYVYYSSHCPLDASGNAPDLDACDDAYPRVSTDGFFNTYLRLSRFEVFGVGLVADPSTEQVLLNIRLYNDSHRGGGLAFRSDGNLYVTIGDQFRYDTAQDIVDTLGAERCGLPLISPTTETAHGAVPRGATCPGEHLVRLMRSPDGATAFPTTTLG